MGSAWQAIRAQRYALAFGLSVLLPGQGQTVEAPFVYAPPETTIETAEARQGVASDGRHIYAVDNSAIGKYEIATGNRVAIFQGDPERFPHLNSCTLAEGELVCASSNFPALPYRNSAEFFDPETIRHVKSVELPAKLGSLTVLDWHNGQWWAFFANYDGKGGAPGRDHRNTALARLNTDFSVVEQWQLPDTVLQRLAPSSISGASWNDDGFLYASGHDKPEVYVLALPEQGDVLRHVRTIAVASYGQAVDFDPTQHRLLWSIDRKQRITFATRLPTATGAGR